jgi:hypothetical protein
MQIRPEVLVMRTASRKGTVMSSTCSNVRQKRARSKLAFGMQPIVHVLTQEIRLRDPRSSHL